MGCCQSTNGEPPEQPAQPIPLVQLLPPPTLARSPKNVSNQQPPWTREHLERQREIFFETQTSGDQQVWATLRAVSEHLRKGELKDAQAIFDAAGLSCPDGNFAKVKQRDPATRRSNTVGGVYDGSGRRYLIPLWCVTDPQDVVETEAEREGAEIKSPGGASIDTSDDEEVVVPAPNSPVGQSSREAKGKERQGDIGDLIQVRARLTSNAEDVKVEMGSKQPVSAIVEQLSEKLSIPQDRLRLMFKGKDLRRDQTLEAQKWNAGDTLSVFIKPEILK